MRRWLANIEARLLDRHARNAVMAAARNHQTPGHSAITTRTKGATMTSSMPRRPLSETAASERPLAPDAPNGLTSGPEGSYAGVVLSKALDTIVRLTRERDAARATIARMRTGRP